jgi:aminoglycoside phosphotransferase (APT) family kinase protein
MEANLDEMAPIGPLTQWLDENVPELGKGPLRRELLHGGTSNVVFTLNRGKQDMVLRRPPAVPPPGAEKGVLREARVLTALRDTEVPTPYYFGSCADPEVIGSPFYVMEKVDGWAPNLRGERIYNEPPFDRMPYEYGIAYAIVGGLALLANVDYKAVGLEDFGKPDNFMERQVDRWASQLKSYPEKYKGYQARSFEGYDETEEWLRKNVRKTEHLGIIHGDVGTPNMMFRHGPPARLAAMIDWELSTIGDPLIDVGGFIGGMRDERFPDLKSETGLTNPDHAPTKQTLMRYYASGTGRKVEDLDFYTVLVGFKYGCILEYKVAQAAAGQLPKETGEFFSRLVVDGFKRTADFIRRIS